MEQNKDQGGAAVRGEAVAEAADDAKFWRDQCEALIDIWDDAQANPPESRAYVDEAWPAMLNGIRANLTSPVPARAADAPSEPSEAMERIFESWDGCDYDGIDIGAALRADFKTFVFGKSRAADAPSNLRQALIDVRHAIQFSHDSVGGIDKMPVMMHHSGTVVEFIDAALSGVAVDAPSEPSEQALWDDNGEPMNDAAEKEWRQCNERIRQRAADALDSQPSTDEPTDREALIACLGDDAATLSRINPDDEMAQTMREAAAMLEADAKALDSQPTEPVADVQARVRDAVAENLRGLYYCGRVWSAWSVGTMGEDDFSPAEEDDDIIANITDAVMATFAPASSQPTDGGVRNG